MNEEIASWHSRVGSAGRWGRLRRRAWERVRLRPGLFRDGSSSKHGIARSATRRGALLFCLALIVLGAFGTLSLRNRRLDRGPGQVIGDFELREVTTGHPHRLSQHRDRLIVIVFIGTNCPVGDLYMPRLSELATRYSSRNVDFLAIDSNASESIADVATYARQSGVTFPILKDPENRVADQLLAERTCETLILDVRGRLRYRGAIDDQYGRRSRRNEPTSNYLVEAIEDLLAGREVSPETTQVVGCPIERTSPPRARRPRSDLLVESGPARDTGDSAATSAGRPDGVQLTYAADVAPILHARCATCHRPGQVAPFSLLSFEQARRWSASIAEVVHDGRMPPWHADRRHGRFANDRSLTPRERSMLELWVEQGARPGDLSRAPAPPRFQQPWSIGSPEVVFEMPEPYLVPAEGTVPIHRVRVATHLTEDLYVQAAEAQPGDRAVVHHICIFVEAPASTSDRTRVWPEHLVTYTPGDMPSVFPAGVGKRIPRGSTLLFEVHYTPIGKPRIDRSSLGLIVSPEPPRRLAFTRSIPQRNLRIPPGDADYVARSSLTLDRDIQLLSLAPHMHLRGKSFVFNACYPDGRTEILLSVPRFDFGWQTNYRLAESKSIPKGTRIECEAHFDNSANNPANPDPKRTVSWGEQSEDEMMIGFMDFY